MRLYDIVVLVTPDLNEEDAVKVTADHRKILTDGGVIVLDGDAHEVDGVGFAGVKGFCGGCRAA